MKRTRKAEASNERATHFLNVDLDIYSRARLEPLVSAFGRKVFVHYVGPEGRMFGAHLSLASYGQSAETLTRDLCKLIARLPSGARKLWNGARRREFNVGIQSGVEPHSHEVRISERTVARVARLGGSILVTTYAPDEVILMREAQALKVLKKSAHEVVYHKREPLRERQK